MFVNVSMEKQRKALLGSIFLVIQHLRKPDTLTEALHALGARHVVYGVESDHYDVVAATLINVLREFAGEAWTTDVHYARADALSAVKTIMLEGARVIKAS